jgi:hypothetical protein
MRKIMALTVVLLGADLSGPAHADEGGYVDPATDLVWSKTLMELGQGSCSRGYSLKFAANYSIQDVDEFGVPRVYSDWRLPTVAELQGAILSGALINVIMRNADGTIRDGYFQTSEGNGKKCKFVVVRKTADRMAVDVAASGAVYVGGDMAVQAVMVRP